MQRPNSAAFACAWSSVAWLAWGCGIAGVVFSTWLAAPLADDPFPNTSLPNSPYDWFVLPSPGAALHKSVSKGVRAVTSPRLLGCFCVLPLSYSLHPLHLAARPHDSFPIVVFFFFFFPFLFPLGSFSCSSSCLALATTRRPRPTTQRLSSRTSALTPRCSPTSLKPPRRS